MSTGSALTFTVERQGRLDVLVLVPAKHRQSGTWPSAL